MANVSVYNIEGKEVGSIELNDGTVIVNGPQDNGNGALGDCR